MNKERVECFIWEDYGKLSRYFVCREGTSAYNMESSRWQGRKYGEVRAQKVT